MNRAYYNEIDPYAAKWLGALIDAGHIAPGDVDTRSIEDVTPRDLAGYTQCHFFAGIGVWSHALRMAGWSDDRRVWTGSCPCQPFSAAGKRGGIADERHLWPAWFHLISECNPEVVFGEQVASKDGRTWLDTVQADLEGMGFAVGAGDICAAGVGAPHIRQRLYFVAESDEGQWAPGRITTRSAQRAQPEFAGSSSARGLGHHHQRSQRHRGLGFVDAEKRREDAPRHGAETGVVGVVADTDGRFQGNGDVQRSKEHRFITQDGGVSLQLEHTEGHGREPRRAESSERRIVGGRSESFWSACDWLPCTDGKARPVEPGTFPLAHGIAVRVGRLRAYGNAIVAPLAKEFIASYMDFDDEGGDK